ncbi:metalloregulator ArsR/SmtB family transcription factor [Shewanella olleyana]|uniref:metalloregulator ArsR/SmtB family transcription factor n=1 Tax=Shewanella olleyana TaxID=135626 RepID=UPI00200C5AB4|nr:metalloregulator ArsR/SmtB family transcription factor [Shewanella olleyana]MCL1067596.1 metalloregulator ArsR/SmtB family transcription factor [Shewanella olleyana]
MKKRILFVCTGNSSRSQMAEAIINRDYRDKYEAFSVGSKPKDIDARTFTTLKLAGYSTSDLTSKPLNHFDTEEFDYLISLCSSARGECSNISGVSETISWDITPPKNVASDERFDKTLEELQERIRLFALIHSDSDEEQFNVETFLKCISDKTRLLITLLLHVEKELSVSEISAALQTHQTKASRCLAHLKSHGVLKDRRQGLRIFYSVSPTLPQWAKVILDQAVIAKRTQLQATLKVLNSTERPVIEH